MKKSPLSTICGIAIIMKDQDANSSFVTVLKSIRVDEEIYMIEKRKV